MCREAGTLDDSRRDAKRSSAHTSHLLPSVCDLRDLCDLCDSKQLKQHTNNLTDCQPCRTLVCNQQECPRLPQGESLRPAATATSNPPVGGHHHVEAVEACSQAARSQPLRQCGNGIRQHISLPHSTLLLVAGRPAAAHCIGQAGNGRKLTGTPPAVRVRAK